VKKPKKGVQPKKEMNQNIWQQFLDTVDMIVSIIKAGRGDPDAWENSIQRFEAQDRLQPPAKNAIVFVGSSSFTLWSTLERDMQPLPVLNRGFGGSRMRDVVQYVDRIVLPYQPRAVVLFAGTNDVTDGKADTARQIFDGYLAFVQQVRAALPQALIYYVLITPAPSRWKYWPIASEANRLIQEQAQSDPNLRCIDLTAQLLDADGKPDRSLYRLDRLHPNSKGYARWTAVIKPRLAADLSFL
jgi:lysophospholipase L1-like esterase